MRGMLAGKAWTRSRKHTALQELWCEEKSYFFFFFWKSGSSNRTAVAVDLQGYDKKTTKKKKQKNMTSYITVKPSSIYVSLSLSENSVRNSLWASHTRTHTLVVSDSTPRRLICRLGTNFSRCFWCRVPAPAPVASAGPERHFFYTEQI